MPSPTHSSPALAWLSGVLTVAAELSGHVLLVGELALVVGIVLFGLGRSMGLPHLFWHEDPKKQGMAGFAVMLLVVALVFLSYLVSPWAAAERVPAYDYLLKAGFALSVVLALPVALFALGRVGVRPDRRLPFVVGAALGVAVVGLLVVGGRGLAVVSSPRICDPHAGYSLARFYGDACADRIRHLIAALVFVSLLAAVYIAGLLRKKTSPMPAVGVCVLLALIASGQQLMKIWLGSAHVLVAIAVGVILVGLSGLSAYKLRYPALASYYEKGARVPLARYVASQTEDGYALLDPSSIPWAQAVPWSYGKRPLVLVCASGGGLRASVWTAAVLCELERTLRGFPYYVRLVTGASGGMVGASYWVATLREPPAQLPDLDDELHDVSRADMVERSGREDLSALAHALIYRDVAYGLSPFKNPWDRGVALEEAFAQNMPEGLRKTFGDLYDGEAAGWRPSLIMTPMLVEDGRRLVISNLVLDPLLAQAGPRAGRPADVLYSHAGYEAARLFPGTFASFPVRTAARMNAAFPVVTPASILPTEPRRRVVDAGYWDNYGVSLGCAFLLECLKTGEDASMRLWLEENVSGVLLVQIRSGVDPREAEGKIVKEEKNPGPLSRGLEWLTSPLSGLLSSQTGAMLFRNDEQVEALSTRFAKEFEIENGLGEGFFTTATFSYRGEASLSWYLTQREKRSLSEESVRVVADQAEALKQWWERATPRASGVQPRALRLV